jgi:hypothetical protein
VHLRQVLLALLDHLAVDVHHQAVGDRLVAEDLPHGGAFTPADDHGLLRPRMGQEPRVHQGLVVDELVGLARLDPPVQHETLAVRVGVHDLHQLELGLAGDDGPGDGMHVPLDRSRGLEEPLVLGRRHRPVN